MDSTGGVEKQSGFSTGRGVFHICPSTFHKTVWKSHRPFLVVFRCLFVSGVDVGGNVFDDLRLYRVVFYQVLNSVEGV